jgi:hypothetical protein
MKSYKIITTFCCLLSTASFLLAEDVEKAISQEPESIIQAGKETRILHRLLEMDNEELTQLRQTIERIEKMSPEEKDQLRTRISAIQQMAPDRVDRLREKFKAIPLEQRNEMHARWMEMGPEEHAELHAKLKSMTLEERQAFLEEKGFLPPHPLRAHKKTLFEDLEEDASEISDGAP